MSHGNSVRIIHGDQPTILPPAGFGNGKIQCDGPLSAAFSRPFTAFRGGVNRRCRRWNSPSPPSSYPSRDHWSRDWVHATVKERAHSPHNGVPALSAATSPIVRRYTPLCMLCPVTRNPNICTHYLRAISAKTEIISITIGVLFENSSDLSSGRRPMSKSDEFSKSTPIVLEI